MRAHGRERQIGKRFALVHGAWHDRSLRRVLGVCVAATALSLALGWSATGAEAADVSCGDTITADTTLHKDLVDCPNNGIVIGADDITLDLNGHTIDGDGSGDSDGVVNLGHDGVTVTNGSVRDFDAGVSVDGVRNNRVLNISIRHIYWGFLFRDAPRTVVRGSSVSGALGNDSAGLLLFFSRHVRILHNSFRHNRKGIEMVGCNSNLIKGNVFSRNEDDGVWMHGSARNRVTRNRFVRNGDRRGSAITLTPFLTTGQSSRNVITHNRVSRGRYGILIEEGRRNLVAHNVVARTHRTGIRLGINPFTGGAHNVVRRNLVRGSREHGFVVAKSDRHSHLKRNISVGARGDGFDVEGRRSKLTRNDARRNGDLGIEAVRGVIDGGGNRASGNGDPRQCTHISCS